MCGIFSKEVLSKHVDVEYRFSAEPYIGASCGNVSVLSMFMPAGEENNLRNFQMAKIKGQVKWFNESKGLASLLRLMAAKMCSYTSPLSRVMASKTLAEGQNVEFEIQDGQKGPAAVNVTAI